MLRNVEIVKKRSGKLVSTVLSIAQSDGAILRTVEMRQPKETNLNGRRAAWTKPCFALGKKHNRPDEVGLRR